MTKQAEIYEKCLNDRDSFYSIYDAQSVLDDYDDIKVKFNLLLNRVEQEGTFNKIAYKEIVDGVIFDAMKGIHTSDDFTKICTYILEAIEDHERGDRIGTLRAIMEYADDLFYQDIEHAKESLVEQGGYYVDHGIEYFAERVSND